MMVWSLMSSDGGLTYQGQSKHSLDITAVLKGLHLLIFLHSSLCTYEPSRSLRSSNEELLKIPKRNLKSFGQRSFSFMAPSLWNSLPATLRNVPTLSQFKSQLKTFLFAQAFLQNLKKCVSVCHCVAVECRWMHMDRERGKGGGERA